MMTKKDIISLVEEIGKDIGNQKKFLFSENETNGKIGNNQFRELASICRSAECYDEIELLIKYNTAKSIKNKKDESWAVLCGNKRFGDVVIEKMEKIQEKEEPHEIDFEFPTPITDRFQGVMEPSHLLGGPAVHGILLADFIGFAANHEPKERDVLA